METPQKSRDKQEADNVDRMSQERTSDSQTRNEQRHDEAAIISKEYLRSLEKQIKSDKK